MAESTSIVKDGEKLKIEDAREIAEFYGVPVALMNMMFVVIGGTAFPKETFLLYQGHKRGVLRIEVDEPEQVDENGAKEWRTEARIYPRIDAKILEQLSRFNPEERKSMWEHLTAPTREWGRASGKNVRMSTMQEWLPQIAIKRAVCRALRLFSGIGTTSFEEIPEVEIPETELRSAKNNIKKAKAEDAEQAKLTS